MGCMDGFVIEASNDWDFVAGMIAADYPGCAMCPDCSYRLNYDREKITEAYREAQEWKRENGKLFLVRWTFENKFGDFQLWSSSLEKAREVAQKSLWHWDSVLVKEISP